MLPCAPRGGSGAEALLYIDLDGFKAINDSCGYRAGDGLLREVAIRLITLARSTDTIARVGADEFLMLMDGDPDSAAATLVADRVRAEPQPEAERLAAGWPGWCEAALARTLGFRPEASLDALAEAELAEEGGTPTR